MIIELIIFSVLGAGLGVVTGLVPGLHINNILPFILTLLVFVGDPYYIAAIIVSMAVVQVFVGFIPSIFLGAPEADTSLSTLPGHKMLHEGRGFEAIKLTIVGGLGSLAVSLILLFALAQYFPSFYELSRPYIQFVLLGIIAFMVLSERNVKKILYASLIVLASGALGFLVLQSSLLPQQDTLFPTLAGLFGISVLATSIMQKSKIPEQGTDNEIRCTKKEILRSIILGSIAGMIVGFLPAVGASQAAAIFQSVGGIGDARNFLMSISGINLANEVFSLNSVHLIGNPRSGASVAIERIFGSVSESDLFLFVSIIIFSAGIGAVTTLVLGKKIPAILARLNYKILSVSIIALMVSMVIVVTGAYGILVMGVATSIGVLCNYLGVRKSNCMGVLIIPSIFFFSGLTPALSTLIGI